MARESQELKVLVLKLPVSCCGRASTLFNLWASIPSPYKD